MNKEPDLNKLKLVIAEKGLTVDQLSKSTGISRDILIALLEGKRKMTLEQMDSFIHVLKLSNNRISEIFLN